jgi:hypothetical protein
MTPGQLEDVIITYFKIAYNLSPRESSDWQPFSDHHELA